MNAVSFLNYIFQMHLNFMFFILHIFWSVEAIIDGHCHGPLLVMPFIPACWRTTLAHFFLVTVPYHLVHQVLLYHRGVYYLLSLPGTEISLKYFSKIFHLGGLHFLLHPPPMKFSYHSIKLLLRFS